MRHKIRWADRGREPQCPPDPRYPEGKDITSDAKVVCHVDLPYPAKRCGLWLIKCEVCGVSVAVTTAGRPDDPRSVEVPCNDEGVSDATLH